MNLAAESEVRPATARLEALFAEYGAERVRVDVIPGPGAESGADIASRLGAIGVKSLLVKGDDGQFRILAIPGRLELDSQRARLSLGLRKLRFARSDELQALTGIEPGGVPPFGPPMFHVELIADASLEGAQRVAFGGGHPTVRFSLAGDDWRRIARPRFERLVG